MVFNTTEDGKGFKCDLSEAELMLAEKNPESFKNYLDYQTKLREDFLSDIREQKIREHELMKQQNELKYADLKDKREKDLENIKNQREKDLENIKNQREKDLENAKDQREKDLENAKDQREKDLENAKDQRDHDYRCRELDAEEFDEYRDFDERRRKDAWAFVLGVGAAAIDNFCSNYQEAKQFVNDLNQLPDSSLDEAKEC